MTIKKVLSEIKKGDYEYVDMRFTDPRGKLQHVTVMASEVDEGFLKSGWMFDGSSIAGWKSINESDMKLVHETYKLMNGKPLILIVRVYNPLVFSEIEPYASSILIDFGVESRSMLDLLSGKFEPSGLLPFQMPIDMKTVELQKEDIPRDMIPYIDSKGNEYDFAYGMNWKGVINDKRVKKYK